MRRLFLYRKRLKGLSLAELMISIVVLSFLSVLLVGVIPATILGLKSAGERANATLLIQGAVEQTRSQSFDDMEAMEFVRTLNEKEYRVTTEVGTAIGSDGTALNSNLVKSLRVRVEWESKGGKKWENFETLVSRSPH